MLFSTADEIAFMFTPSLVMEDDEINYFFDSVEDAFEKGIRKIIGKQQSPHKTTVFLYAS